MTLASNRYEMDSERRREIAGLSVWILVADTFGRNGIAGFEVQALGICEALGVTPEVKHISPGIPHRWLAPWGPAALTSDMTPPWPDLLIASGRQTIPYARSLRRKAAGKTFVTVLQSPKVPPGYFDLVWVPAHDRLQGSNVFSTLTSPHHLTRGKLVSEAKRIDPSLAHLPRPRIAVLLGGTNAAYRFSARTCMHMGERLAAFAAQSDASHMITPSRRTSEMQIRLIRECLAGTAAVMWNGVGHNPYFGYLGQADAIVVTSDSINMIGEAVSTGVPVYIYELDGGSPKFRRFLDDIYTRGAARPFGGPLERWTYQPINATHEIAEAIARGLSSRRPGISSQRTTSAILGR